jgi:hypothetical protein
LVFRAKFIVIGLNDHELRSQLFVVLADGIDSTEQFVFSLSIIVLQLQCPIVEQLQRTIDSRLSTSPGTTFVRSSAHRPDRCAYVVVVFVLRTLLFERTNRLLIFGSSTFESLFDDGRVDLLVTRDNARDQQRPHADKPTIYLRHDVSRVHGSNSECRLVLFACFGEFALNLLVPIGHCFELFS